MIILDVLTGLPVILLEYVDIVEVVSTGIVLAAVGFIGSLVSSRNL